MNEINIFIYIAIILIFAFYAKKLSKKIGLPEVTTYVLVGVIIGKSLLNILNEDTINGLNLISSFALGIIAFTIGIELKWSTLKKLGKSIFFIVIFECLSTFIIVFLVLSKGLHLEIYKCLLLAAVASATAPAATVAVIKQYKAKGSLTSTIMAVVGIDDAIALVIYVVALSFSRSIMTGCELHPWLIFFKSSINISKSILLGVACGLLYLLLTKKLRNEDSLKLIIFTFLFLLLGLSEYLKVSELLTIMSFGAIISNLSPVTTIKSEKIIDFVSPIILAMFFIIGGAHLDLSLIKKIGFTGLIYFLARSFGKIVGARIGAEIGGAEKNVKKYIGFALLPQVGVALALALSISKEFDVPKFGIVGHETAVLIINVLLFTTIITELIGPLTTKLVLKKSGEIL